VSFVVNAADLRAPTPASRKWKYADDTYVIIPAANRHSPSDELDHVHHWTKTDNLTLNGHKSKEIKSHLAAVVSVLLLPPYWHVFQALSEWLSTKLRLSVTITDRPAVCERTCPARHPQVYTITVRHQGAPLARYERPGTASRLPIRRLSQVAVRVQRLVGLHNSVWSKSYRSRRPSWSPGWSIPGRRISGSSARWGRWRHIVYPPAAMGCEHHFLLMESYPTKVTVTNSPTSTPTMLPSLVPWTTVTSYIDWHLKTCIK